MLLEVLLLASTGLLRLRGDPSAVVSRNLRCVNNYLYTVNCTLSIQPPDGRYHLLFTETHDRTVFTCPLTKADGEFSCSFQTNHPRPEDGFDDDDDDDDDAAIFNDQDRYEISLCRGREEGAVACERLGAKYNPAHNITPNAPRRLAVRPESSRHLFTWTSTYEPYGDVTSLVQALDFQLRYYKRGDPSDESSHVIQTNQLNYSVADEHFDPNTKYAARVRSSPDQTFFMGTWSDWSSEVHWDTPPSVKGVHAKLLSNALVSGLVTVLVPLCVAVWLSLLFCCAPMKKYGRLPAIPLIGLTNSHKGLSLSSFFLSCRWRQGAFIPTPALHFPTPNSNCQGEFKSWAVTEENTADMLKAEETLQIDTVSECDVPEEEEEERQDQVHHQLTEGSVYNNVLLLGVPYAVSSMAPPSPPGSPVDGDSGCWMEKYCPMYFNEYCTLSALQDKGLTGGAEQWGRGPHRNQSRPDARPQSGATEAEAD